MNDMNLDPNFESNESETKTGYEAPKMSAVGKSTDLIQGAKNVILDWPGSWGTYD